MKLNKICPIRSTNKIVIDCNELCAWYNERLNECAMYLLSAMQTSNITIKNDKIVFDSVMKKKDTKKVKCHYCNGSGKAFTNNPQLPHLCSECDGVGYIKYTEKAETVCPDCNGKGLDKINPGITCKYCNGEGIL